MSPEYALDGKFSIKSDVFSFGVVMLEIISGRKNTGFYNPKEVLNLLGYVSVFTHSTRLSIFFSMFLHWLIIEAAALYSGMEIVV